MLPPELAGLAVAAAQVAGRHIRGFAAVAAAFPQHRAEQPAIGGLARHSEPPEAPPTEVDPIGLMMRAGHG
ncbi:MAG: hypothetical protein V4529_16550 [Gemmatimonadota bacterium]